MEKVKIKDFTNVITGGTPSTSKTEYWENGNIPWLNSGELNQKFVTFSRNYITKLGLEKSSTRLMPEDTVLMALTGSTTGVVGYLTFEACANQSVTGILPSKNHVPKYLYYYLNYIRPKVLNDAYGGAQPHISQGYIKELEIPLPNLPTQQKIANILDKADELRQYNKQLIEKYDALTQSLFLDMFGDPVKNEKGWEMEKLSKVAPFKRYDGVINKTNGEYWLLNLDMIEQQKGKIIEKKFVLENEINASTISFCENQVLYSKLRPYLNKVLIPDESGYGTSELVPMNPKLGIIDKFFLAYLLRTNNFVNYINDKVAGAKMPRVNMDTLRDFNTITPPIALQNQFAERVAIIEAQKQQAQEALAKSEALFQGLLQQAFNGELN